MHTETTVAKCSLRHSSSLCEVTHYLTDYASVRQYMRTCTLCWWCGWWWWSIMPEHFFEMAGPLNHPIVAKITWCDAITLLPRNITRVNATRRAKWRLYKVFFFRSDFKHLRGSFGRTAECHAESLCSIPARTPGFYSLHPSRFFARGQRKTDVISATSHCVCLGRMVYTTCQNYSTCSILSQIIFALERPRLLIEEVTIRVARSKRQKNSLKIEKSSQKVAKLSQG